MVLQLEGTECGAACLGIILAYFGRWVSLHELREACNVGRDGSNGDDIMKAARSFGLKAAGWRKEIDRLKTLKMPLIIFWKFHHFVVLEGIGQGGYYLNDPSSGHCVVDDDEFDRCFTGVAISFEPDESFQPNKPPPGILYRFWAWLGHVRPALGYAVLCGLFLIFPGLALPLLLSVFVDHVLGSQMVSGSALVLLMLVAGTSIYALTWLQMRTLRKMAVVLSIQQSDRYLMHLLQLPMHFFSRRYAGDLATRMQLIDDIAQSGTGQLTGLMIELVMSLAFLAMMLWFDALLGAVVGLLGVACLLLTRVVTSRRTDYNHKLLREQGLMMGVGVVGISTIETMKATGFENSFFSRFGGYQARELSARQKFAELGHVTASLPPLFLVLGSAVVLGLGGWRVMSGDMTIGVLIGFNVVAGNFLGPIGRFVQFADVLQTMNANMQRLNDVFESETDKGLDKQDATPSSGIVTLAGRARLAGRVELRNLTFGFQRNRPPLLENFSLIIEPGQRVAIVGPSGSGKSTLSLLIVGVYQPWSGEILFDGYRREEIPQEILYSSISSVNQNVVLFSATVRENLTLWNPTVSDDAIVAAARDAAIHDDIIARPLGYNSEVEESGRNFSGGQRQRLEIARALCNNPSVLVLDEATSGLDTVNELYIDYAIRRRGCTSLIVAHRLSTVRDSDLIVVLRNGKEVQRGTHDELIALKEGLYCELARPE